MRKLGLNLGWCFVVALALVVLTFQGTPAFAQDVTATITGTVTDQSGAPVVGATVTAKSVERGTTFTGPTNEEGLFRITQLPIGNYELRIEKTGFQSAVRPSFNLALNQIARVDVELKVGQVSDTIEVTSAAPILKTEATQIDTIINSATNEALPLATRNYVELTLLAPGSVHPDPSGFNNGDNVANGARPFINGNREQANNFILDGMDNNQVSDNLLGYTPSPDAIEEFNLITNNAPAEFGNFMGGIVSVSMKSGTNAFHGNVWEFLRNDKFNANKWENKINANSQIARDPLRWNMFGGTFGGPILKNKLFFFVDYQGQRFDHPPAGNNISVFTPAEQGGNFSALCQTGFTAGICNPPSGPDDTRSHVQLYNPCAPGTGVSGTPCTPSAAPNAQRPAFANNIVPANMINPVATALFGSNLYPTAINSQLTGNAVNNISQQFNSDQGDVKIDYRMSNKDSFSGRFTRAMQTDPTSNSFLLLGNGLATAPIWSTVGDWTRSISSSLVNDARFGWNHVILNTGTTWDPQVGAFGQTIGIANSNPSGLALGLMGIGFGGGSPSGPGTGTLTNIGNSMVTQSFNSAVYQADDSVTWVRGRHSFKFGAEFMYNDIKVFYSGNSGELGNITFGSIFTASSAVCTDNSSTANCKATNPTGGDGMADFFLGLPNSFGRGLTSGGWEQTSKVISGYAQDTWRATDHLTLTLGLRYEAHTPWVESNNQEVNFNPVTGNVEYAGKNGASSALYKGVYGGRAFQPRLGFAWTPGRFNGKTVVRGAFTVSDYLEGTGTNLRLPINPPFNGGAGSGEFQTLYQNQALPATTSSDGVIVPPPSGTDCSNLACFNGAVFRMWDQNVQPAIDDQWNLTIQHQFAPNTTLQVGYVGQTAYHLMVPFYYGQPVAEPSTSCGTPPCTSPSPFFANGQGPQLLSEISTVSGTQSNGRMTYNALQAVFQRSQSHGLQYQVSYTYAKCMSNNTGYYGTWSGSRASSTASPYWQNIYDVQAEWSPCYYDETHNLTSYAVYELPIGKGKKFLGDASGAVNQIVGGWKISPIVTLHTGFPLALYNNGDDHTGTASRGLRPDCNGTNKVFGRQTSTNASGGIQWFDKSNYSNAVGFGTCAPQLGGLRGPGFYNWDASIQKDFLITERFKLQFRTDFLNMFNRVNLAVPNTTVESSTTGLIQASQPPRNIQFALKLFY